MADFEKAPPRTKIAKWFCERTTFLEHEAVGESISEFFGTSLIVIFGCGTVNASLSTAQNGIWQVAVVWALGVSLAIYMSAHISGAHLNPAVTIAFATWRKFPLYKVPRYVISQVLGGVFGGAMNLFIFQGIIHQYEVTHGITRGEQNSIPSAATFGMYFPNPYLYPHDDPMNVETCPVSRALFVEAWGTFLLGFLIFGATDPRNHAIGLGQNKVAVPAWIGALIGVMLSLYAPITMAGFNPARDLGPRLVAAAAGWGAVSFPGPRDAFWIYTVGPLVGGVLGGGFYDMIVGRSLGGYVNSMQPEPDMAKNAVGITLE
mmetsp:Transcript_28658/g.62525  ORF Transcript_28658/g.62525 Transcript_28658/m.62525 type:complete len:318 (-) Transcript_28658:298-1251(-)